MKLKHILIFGLIILLTCTYLSSAEPDFTQRVVTNASNFIHPGSYTEPPYINESYNENEITTVPTFFPYILGLVIVFGIILLIKQKINKKPR